MYIENNKTRSFISFRTAEWQEFFIRLTLLLFTIEKINAPYQEDLIGSLLELKRLGDE